jgi:hypothetical protein
MSILQTTAAVIFFYVRDTHRLVHETDRFEGITWAHVVSRQPLTAEVRFRARVSPYGICGEQSGSETDFSPSFSVFPCQYRSTVALHTRILSGD